MVLRAGSSPYGDKDLLRTICRLLSHFRKFFQIFPPKEYCVPCDSAYARIVYCVIPLTECVAFRVKPAKPAFRNGTKEKTTTTKSANRRCRTDSHIACNQSTN